MLRFAGDGRARDHRGAVVSSKGSSRSNQTEDQRCTAGSTDGQTAGSVSGSVEVRQVTENARAKTCSYSSAARGKVQYQYCTW